MTEIFRTVHGSHLYGIAHEGSDMDTYVVTTEDNGHLRQHTDGVTDITRGGWKTFVRLAMSGSHQSCEALFSAEKIWTPEGERFKPFIEGIHVTGGEVAAKYERTIRKFAHLDFKRRRHACRLADNLSNLREFGRFDPRMSAQDIWWANITAENQSGDELADYLISCQTAPRRLRWMTHSDPYEGAS